jgi:fatty-acid desaturase
MTQTPDRIREKISDTIGSLAPHLRSWVDNHLIAPREVRLSLDPHGQSFKTFWLVTDHSGTKDASYRVAYNDETNEFGLECTMDTDVEWYMGDYGSFAETIENM